MQSGDGGSPAADGLEVVVKIAGSVAVAVKSDLEAIAKRDPVLAQSALAASALALAKEMDATNSATSKSMCARALLETMDRIRELAPVEQVGDGVDALAARRAARRGAA